MDMKKLMIFAAGILFLGFAASYTFKDNNEQVMIEENVQGKVFHGLKVKSISGDKEIDFSTFKGKKVLLVNTASECGYTGQYEDLEKLHQKYKDKLVVIGFPCNQFGGQEPGSAEEIVGFCKKNYGVSFLLTEKIDVKGDNQHLVYRWLTQKSLNGVGDYTVEWNFNKFLVDENGKLVKYFPSRVKPLSDELVSLIEK